MEKKQKEYELQEKMFREQKLKEEILAQRQKENAIKPRTVESKFYKALGLNKRKF